MTIYMGSGQSGWTATASQRQVAYALGLPIKILSLASSKAMDEIASLLCFAALSAASLIILLKSAPLKPGVLLAITWASTSSVKGLSYVIHTILTPCTGQEIRRLTQNTSEEALSQSKWLPVPVDTEDSTATAWVHKLAEGQSDCSSPTSHCNLTWLYINMQWTWWGDCEWGAERGITRPVWLGLRLHKSLYWPQLYKNKRVSNENWFRQSIGLASLLQYLGEQYM